MKKAILMMLAAAFILASCAEEKNPPTASFTLSSDTAIQWDMVTITDEATGAEATEYAITGGGFEYDEASMTIQFLDAATYTITQTATNADGTNEVSEDIVVTEPVNTYKMSFYIDSDLSIMGDAYWFPSSMGGPSQIRISGEGATAQATPNTVKVIPIAGGDPIYGTGTRLYTWSDSGDIGTYNTQFTHYPETGDAWDAAWFTATAGSGVTITLVYEASNPDNNVYDITMNSTTLDGYYDATYMPQTGIGMVLVTYRGVITPES